MVGLTLLSISLVVPLVVHAANDWSKPCFKGKCSYDLRKSDGTVDGTMRIEGSPDAISDITPAAGWLILGCDPEAEAQDIRIVCESPDPEKCDHLYRSIGPQGKLVRLPENCGKMAFARVVKSWVDEDQTLPAEVKSHLMRRGIHLPEVKALSIDTDFAAIDPTETGPVYISIQGSTIPGAVGNATITNPEDRLPIRRNRYHSRGSNAVESAFDRFASTDNKLIKNLPPLDIYQNFPIISESFSCSAPGGNPGVSASVDASLDADIHAVVQIGVAAEGTIVPPELTSFGLFAALDADLSGSLNIAASASGSLDTGEVTIFEHGLPGLDFPGVLSIGPIFRLAARASTTVEGSVNTRVGVSYKVDNAQLFFPKTSRKRSSGKVGPKSTPLKLSADPSISAKGSVSAHIIPKIEFGISALKGIARATVHLDVDASASVNLDWNAKVNAAHTFGAKGSNSVVPAVTPSGYATRLASASQYPEPLTSVSAAIPSAVGSQSPSATAPDTPNAPQSVTLLTSNSPVPSIPNTPKPITSLSFNPPPGYYHPYHPTEDAQNPKRDIDASVEGCVHVDAGFDAGAGVEGKFFGLFDEGTRVSLFEKRFDIYKQCWGASTSAKTRRAMYRVSPPPRPDMHTKQHEKRCFPPEFSKLFMFIDQVIPGDSIKPRT